MGGAERPVPPTFTARVEVAPSVFVPVKNGSWLVEPVYREEVATVSEPEEPPTNEPRVPE